MVIWPWVLNFSGRLAVLRLFLLFTLVPLAELVLLMWISRYTTVLGTIAIVLATGFAGAALARHQGWRTWQRLQEELRSGKPPADALLDGVMILIAGALMITPGVLTDAVGFALLFPPVRFLLKGRLRNRLMSQTTVQFHSFGGTGEVQSHDDSRTNVIDAEFTRKSE